MGGGDAYITYILTASFILVKLYKRFGGVDMEDIRGVRVPFLSVGWNRQFLMMREFGFVYDSSMTAPVSDPPLWPYTLDYQIPHKCIGKYKGYICK